MLRCGGYLSPQSVLDLLPQVIPALYKNPRMASLAAELEHRFNSLMAQKRTEYGQTCQVSEATFDGVSALLEEGVWFPKVESSAGRSLMIDLNVVREFAPGFDFQALAAWLMVDTDIRAGHLQTLDYLYLVDC